MRRTPLGTLTDTGPLFALVDPISQPEQFARYDTLLASLPPPLVTPWPCMAEAMYLCGRTGGWPMQRLLWRYVTARVVRLHAPTDAETARMAVLMESYRDRPMDMADASLVAIAESLGYTRIFSIDSDFYVYRLADGTTLEVLPGPFTRR